MSITGDGKKKWYIHMMKYHSAVSRNNLLTQAASRINLKNITLSERTENMLCDSTRTKCSREANL